MGRNDVGDHAGRAGNEHVVAGHANPLMAARRCLQAMLTPVVDPEDVVTVFRRQPVATMPVAMRNRTDRSVRPLNGRVRLVGRVLRLRCERRRGSSKQGNDDE